ncbi:hypothetical protein JOC73_001482 [Alkaliphilus hydrothermalis]|uniref:Uncharacterized protein n=1 Tax=Alkaliphilus hydrothermalis TaxID=1482730 RepID=A0ABS2NPQ8_9FIRM|nr:hypothetical protein [Alkaliphilus hydrothermalis]
MGGKVQCGFTALSSTGEVQLGRLDLGIIFYSKKLQHDIFEKSYNK